MAKSQVVLKLDEVQAAAQLILQPIGFKKRGRAFNRTREDGLVQVVAFQAGAFEIGDGTFGQPGFYGKFCINLGIYIEEAYERSNPPKKPNSSVLDADCSIRSRLSWLEAGRDYWWSLDEPTDVLAERVDRLLTGFGMPFLDRFATRDLVLADLDNQGADGRYWRISRLDAAMIFLKRGDRSSAHALLEKQIAESSDHPGHRAYVRELAERLGLAVLR